MVRFASGEIGISQGEALLVSDFDTEGPMWTGQGERTVRQRIEFPERFLTPPVVQVGIVMWDTDVSTNQRGDIRVEAITSGGFDLVFHTWGDTRLARLRVQWTALGALPDDLDLYP